MLLAAAGAAAWAASGPAGTAAPLARRAAAAATAGVYMFAGLPAAVDLSYDLTAGRVDTHLLMNLAVLGTLCTGHALEGALLLVLFQTSHFLEHALTGCAQGSLAALRALAPSVATRVALLADDRPDLSTARSVPPSQLAVGDCMLVKPGEQVPLDGVVVVGRALMSSEHITGESLPVLKSPGDEVAAGSLNRDGVLVVRALSLEAESTPARIAKLAMDAQAERPQLRSWLDQFGEAYSRMVIVASVAALCMMLATGVPLLATATQRGAFCRAMGLLTVAAPCALVLAPLAYVSAIAAAASRGVLLKGGRVLDALATCRTVAFDKTGTLTTGALVCRDVRPLSPGGAVEAERRAALAAAAALSARSSHPVSDAALMESARAGLGDAARLPVDDFQLVAGGGVEGTVALGSLLGSAPAGPANLGSASDGRRRAMFGSADYVAAHLTAQEAAAARRAAGGGAATSVQSVLVLSAGGPTPEFGNGNGGGDEAASAPGASGGGGEARSVWLFTFEDSIRQQSAEAVRALQTGSWSGRPSASSAVRVIMLTGDSEASAQNVGRQLGIKDVRAALTPERKLAAVRGLAAAPRAAAGGGNGERRARFGGVVMVGDGLNDAAALAAATVGVAIAPTAGAAAALAADAIVLDAGAVAALPFLLALARATQAVVRQNLALAGGSIAVLALPTVLGWVPLWAAVSLHEGATLLVALNSLRLLAHGAQPAAARAAGIAAVPAPPEAPREGVPPPADVTAALCPQI